MIRSSQSLRKKRLIAPLAAALALNFCSHSGAQTTPDPDASEGNQTASHQAEDGFARARMLLNDIRDNVFSFDHPAFYRFRNHVKADPDTVKYEVVDDDKALPWSFLLERPSDYRGELVLIEGKLLKRHPPYKLPEHRGKGLWYQYELGRGDTRAVCTVIATEEEQKIPIRSEVRAKGYFIMVRAFKTDSGETSAGPLLVARRLEYISPPGLIMDKAPGIYTWLAGATAVLAVVWLMLRRGLRSSASKSDSTLRSAKHKHESDDDFDWLIKTDQGDEP